MIEVQIGEILLELGILFLATVALGGLLHRIRIPAIIAALLVAMAAHYTPLGERLLSAELYGMFTFLAQLGVLFLLFFIGVQIDFVELRSMGRDILWLTVFATGLPFVFGVLAMLGMGYGWGVALVIGMTRMPTAEAVIVPILDEFGLIRTRVGRFIVGAGTLDDVLEVALVAIVSVWIAEDATAAGAVDLWGKLWPILAGLAGLLTLAVLSYRWILPLLARWTPRDARGLVMISLLTMLLFGGLSEQAELGMVLGAILSGIVMRPTFQKIGIQGDQAIQTFRQMSYGFLGIVFFFWVGMSADLAGLAESPLLALLLFLAASAGKIGGTLLMVPMKKMSFREALTTGVGLDARLTTEIVVAQILYSAKLIDLELFTALIAASSVSTLLIPLWFTLLARRWGHELHGEPAGLGDENVA
ncbi:MAG: cation:proton antiporter [Chrysiogenetes bacterium]|nr:cation:proton antiporter [Chrysiogenetes bacterium]